MDPLNQARSLFAPGDLSAFPDVNAADLPPVRVWEPGPDWSPSMLEYRIYLKASIGAQPLQIVTDLELNPFRYGLPCIMRIIQETGLYYAEYFDRLHRDSMMSQFKILEHFAIELYECFQRSKQPKTETIVEPSGKRTVKITERNGDTAYLDLAYKFMDKANALAKEISAKMHDKSLPTSGFGDRKKNVQKILSVLLSRAETKLPELKPVLDALRPGGG